MQNTYYYLPLLQKGDDGKIVIVQDLVLHLIMKVQRRITYHFPSKFPISRLLLALLSLLLLRNRPLLDDNIVIGIRRSGKCLDIAGDATTIVGVHRLAFCSDLGKVVAHETVSTNWAPVRRCGERSDDGESSEDGEVESILRVPLGSLKSRSLVPKCFRRTAMILLTPASTGGPQVRVPHRRKANPLRYESVDGIQRECAPTKHDRSST